MPGSPGAPKMGKEPPMMPRRARKEHTQGIHELPKSTQRQPRIPQTRPRTTKKAKELPKSPPGAPEGVPEAPKVNRVDPGSCILAAVL